MGGKIRSYVQINSNICVYGDYEMNDYVMIAPN